MEWLDTPIDLALVFGSLVIAAPHSAFRFSIGGQWLSRTFPSIHYRHPIINFDISIRLITSSQREEIFACAARTFLESDGEMNKVELILLAVTIKNDLPTYIEIF